MECNCKDWEECIEKLDDVYLIAQIHGMKYEGKLFKYCPWCSKKLTQKVDDESE